IRRVRKLTEDRQKLGNKMATGKASITPKSALRVLNTGQGTTTDPTRIMTIIESYYKEKLCVPGGGANSGLYLPDNAARTTRGARTRPSENTTAYWKMPLRW